MLLGISDGAQGHRGHITMVNEMPQWSKQNKVKFL